MCFVRSGWRAGDCCSQLRTAVPACVCRTCSGWRAVRSGVLSGTVATSMRAPCAQRLAGSASVPPGLPLCGHVHSSVCVIFGCTLCGCAIASGGFGVVILVCDATTASATLLGAAHSCLCALELGCKQHETYWHRHDWLCLCRCVPCGLQSAATRAVFDPAHHSCVCAHAVCSTPWFHSCVCCLC
jgi:hypothetical protein